MYVVSPLGSVPRFPYLCFFEREGCQPVCNNAAAAQESENSSSSELVSISKLDNVQSISSALEEELAPDEPLHKRAKQEHDAKEAEVTAQAAMTASKSSNTPSRAH